MDAYKVVSVLQDGRLVSMMANRLPNTYVVEYRIGEPTHPCSELSPLATFAEYRDALAEVHNWDRQAIFFCEVEPARIQPHKIPSTLSFHAMSEQERLDAFWRKENFRWGLLDHSEWMMLAKIILAPHQMMYTPVGTIWAKSVTLKARIEPQHI